MIKEGEIFQMAMKNQGIKQFIIIGTGDEKFIRHISLGGTLKEIGEIYMLMDIELGKIRVQLAQAEIDRDKKIQEKK